MLTQRRLVFMSGSFRMNFLIFLSKSVFTYFQIFYSQCCTWARHRSILILYNNWIHNLSMELESLSFSFLLAFCLLKRTFYHCCDKSYTDYFFIILTWSEFLGLDGHAETNLVPLEPFWFVPSKGETTNSGCAFSQPAEKICLSHGNINFLEFWVMQISGCRVHVVTSVLIKIDHFSYGLSTKITPNLMPIWVSIRTTHIVNSIYHWDLMSNWKH